jgi:hypothetical protein
MTNQSKLFIYALLSFTLFLASLFLYTNQINSKAEAHQTATQADTKIEKLNNLITEQFTITEISKGEYHATNNLTGTDKSGLYFAVDDIQGNTSLSVNDQVKAYYEPFEGEDEFIKVTKVN